VVRLVPGVTNLEAARSRVRDVLIAFQQRRPDASLPVVLTWEEMHGALLSAVANEKGLVTFLFVIISVVAVVMVATTFFVIVQQKTRDIGVLRAIGASRAGLLVMFLGYGLAIGVIGGVLGLIGAVLLVNNLNDVQHFLATRLGVTTLLIAPAVIGGVVGAMVATVIGFRQQALLWWLGRLIPTGVLLGLVPAVASLFLFEDWPAWLNANIRFVMWDPQTYFFDEIPGRVDPWEAGPIVLGAILSSVLGAVVPALVASAKKPVDALRYE
jgi:lipoprotein-releasing system permease protein